MANFTQADVEKWFNACIEGDLAGVKTYMDAGIDVDLRDANGKSALYKSIEMVDSPSKLQQIRKVLDLLIAGLERQYQNAPHRLGVALGQAKNVADQKIKDLEATIAGQKKNLDDTKVATDDLMGYIKKEENPSIKKAYANTVAKLAETQTNLNQTISDNRALIHEMAHYITTAITSKPYFQDGPNAASVTLRREAQRQRAIDDPTQGI
jgi:hypothetical protein